MTPAAIEGLRRWAETYRKIDVRAEDAASALRSTVKSFDAADRAELVQAFATGDLASAVASLSGGDETEFAALTGALESAYEALYEPTIESIEPDEGDEAGGTDVTITGTKFAEDVEVEFDGTPATEIVRVSETTITCKTPVGTGAVDVVAINPTANLSATATEGFTYTGEE